MEQFLNASTSQVVLWANALPLEFYFLEKKAQLRIICSWIETFRSRCVFKSGGSIKDLREFGRNYDMTMKLRDMLFTIHKNS